MTTVQRELQRHSDIICFALICYIALGRGISFLSSLNPAFLNGEIAAALFSLAGYIICAALPLLILFVGLKPKWADVKGKSERGFLPKALVLFFACIFAMYLLDIGFSLLGISLESPALFLPDGAVQIVVFVLTSVLLPAVFEELLFRGIALSVLEDYGRRFALVVTALLFALICLDPIRMPARFLLGLLLGILIQRGASLIAVMGLHLLYNLLMVVYGLSLLRPGSVFRWIWNGALGIGTLCAVVVVVLWAINLFRRDRNKRTSLRLDTDQRVGRFFLSVPAVALLFAVFFLSAQMIGLI